MVFLVDGVVLLDASIIFGSFAKGKEGIRRCYRMMDFRELLFFILRWVTIFVVVFSMIACEGMSGLRRFLLKIGIIVIKFEIFAADFYSKIALRSIGPAVTITSTSTIFKNDFLLSVLVELTFSVPLAVSVDVLREIVVFSADGLQVKSSGCGGHHTRCLLRLVYSLVVAFIGLC